MIVKFLLSLVCIFHLVHCYTRICGKHLSDANEYLQEYGYYTFYPYSEDSYRGYCYYFYKEPGWNQRESDVACGNWYDNGRIISIYDESDFLDSLAAKTGTNTFYSGLVRTAFTTECPGWGSGDDVAFLDGSSTGVVRGPGLTFSCVADDQKVCYRYSPATSTFYHDTCTLSGSGIDTVCKIRVPVCGTYRSFDAQVCSGHGSCIHLSHEKSLLKAKGTCICDPPYTGSVCQTTHKCGVLKWDQLGVCNNQGNCSSSNICTCNEGFYGDECEKTVEEISVCDGTGEWMYEDGCYKLLNETGVDVVEMESQCVGWGGNLVSITGFGQENALRSRFGHFVIGLQKHSMNNETGQMYPCPLIYGYDWSKNESTAYALAKGSRLRCESDDACFAIKDDFFWDDIPCHDSSLGLKWLCQKSVPFCFGVSSSSLDQCSGRGKCVNQDVCECKNSYTGDNCQTWECFGVRHYVKSNINKLSPCSGHGACVAPNKCICDPNYHNTDCSLTFCANIRSDDTNRVCSGHGKCTSYNKCTCEDKWGGDYCLSPHAFLVKADCQDLSSASGVMEKCLKNWGNLSSLQGFSNSSSTISMHYLRGIDESGQPDISLRLSAWQHEANAYENWYPGKGHLFSVHNLEMSRWGYDVRHEYFPTGADLQNAVFMGLIKKYTSSKYCNAACDYGDAPCICDSDTKNSWACDNPRFQGYFNTDGTAVQNFQSCVNNNIDNFVQAYCDSDTGCFRFFETEGCREAGTVGGGNCKTTLTGHSINDYQCDIPAYGLYAYWLHFCHGIREDDPNVCGGKGFCWKENECSCHGDKGYFGNECGTRFCSGIESTQDSVCSGHGTCTNSSTCLCDEGYVDENCNTTSCFGVLTNDTNGQSLCSGHGRCIDYDKCECTSSRHFGKECQKTICKNVRSDDTKNVCSGHGVCTDFNVCKCNKSSGDVYGGKFCDIFYCYGVRADDHLNVCGGRGNCIDHDTCSVCMLNYYSVFCNVTTCNGVFSNDSTQCSNHGSCIGYNKCNCSLDWAGPYCDAIDVQCFGHSNESAYVCNGVNGDCKTSDTCICKNEYLGEECVELLSKTANVMDINEDTVKLVIDFKFPITNGGVKNVLGGSITNGQIIDCGTYLEYPDYPNLVGSSPVCTIQVNGDFVEKIIVSVSDVMNAAIVNTNKILNFTVKMITTNETKEVNVQSYCARNRYGDDCELEECFGIISNYSVCSGQGKCVKTDSCDCNVNGGYNGKHCDEFMEGYPHETFMFVGSEYLRFRYFVKNGTVYDGKPCDYKRRINNWKDLFGEIVNEDDAPTCFWRFTDNWESNDRRTASNNVTYFEISISQNHPIVRVGNHSVQIRPVSRNDNSSLLTVFVQGFIQAVEESGGGGGSSDEGMKGGTIGGIVGGSIFGVFVVLLSLIVLFVCCVFVFMVIPCCMFVLIACAGSSGTAFLVRKNKEEKEEDPLKLLDSVVSQQLARQKKGYKDGLGLDFIDSSSTDSSEYSTDSSDTDSSSEDEKPRKRIKIIRRIIRYVAKPEDAKKDGEKAEEEKNKKKEGGEGAIVTSDAIEKLPQVGDIEMKDIDPQNKVSAGGVENVEKEKKKERADESGMSPEDLEMRKRKRKEKKKKKKQKKIAYLGAIEFALAEAQREEEEESLDLLQQALFGAKREQDEITKTMQKLEEAIEVESKKSEGEREKDTRIMELEKMLAEQRRELEELKNEKKQVGHGKEENKERKDTTDKDSIESFESDEEEIKSSDDV